MQMIRRAEVTQWFAAVVVFGLGASVYLFDRHGSDIYFIPAWWDFANGTPALFGYLGQNIPSFAHTFCFILLISALLTPWRVAPLTVCLGWCVTEAALELAQIAPIAGGIAARLPAWFSDWPILANVPGYFSLGRFDPLDLVSIGLGGVAAYLTILFINRSARSRPCH